jgi:MOSC domain-containing protein YiiM
MASVHQINIGGGGVPKLPIDEVGVDINGIIGDDQASKEHHGGPDRALCLFSLQVIEALQTEGHPIAPGSTGENLTITGLDWDRVGPDSRLRIGQTVAQITNFTSPCWKIVGSFSDRDSARISQAEHPGWSRVYAKVIISGAIRTGDDVEVID